MNDMSKTTYLVIFSLIAVFAVQAAVLLWLGHSFFCPCGYVTIWASVRGIQNSQQLADWYSLNHVAYGIVGYFALWLIGKKFRWNTATLLIIILVLSLGWEIFENTSYVTHKFRAETVSFDYYEDSVINSLMDTIFVVLGFLFAYSIPLWATLGLMGFLEIMTLVTIHEGLILSAIMFIHPFNKILAWQASIWH